MSASTRTREQRRSPELPQAVFLSSFTCLTTCPKLLVTQLLCPKATSLRDTMALGPRLARALLAGEAAGIHSRVRIEQKRRPRHLVFTSLYFTPK